MDYYRTTSPPLTPWLNTVPSPNATYFSPQTNSGVLGASKVGTSNNWFDVCHVIDRSGATAWFRYRIRTGFTPYCPHLIIPVVSCGVSTANSNITLVTLS